MTVVREDAEPKLRNLHTNPVTPTAKPAETTDIQGATQTGKPVFTEGDSRVPMNKDVPATFDDGSTTKLTALVLTQQQTEQLVCTICWYSHQR